MIYFEDGLDEKSLKKRYRELAKQWHPDVCDDPQATEIMKEINKQFDEYFTNQKIREFAWMDIVKAKQKARQFRDGILVWLRRDKTMPGKFFTILRTEVDNYYYGNLPGYSSFRPQVKAITDDGDEWNNFTGGLAYCAAKGSYRYMGFDSILTRLPAKITPASLPELYYYNKDHWGNTKWDKYVQLKCRFGVFCARIGNEGYTLFVKCELPDSFVMIGEDDGRAVEYAARTINTVFIKPEWVKEAKELEYMTGCDIPYKVFQDCTREEFERYHDTAVPPSLDMIRAKEVRQSEDFWWISDPVVLYYVKKGIVKIFESPMNFRMHYGYFDLDKLEENMQLLTIEDAEEVQDYLDTINGEFEDYFKRLVKKGKVKYQI